MKELKAPAVGVGGARFKTRIEWANLTGALAAMGTRFEAEDLAGLLFGERRVPWIELGLGRVYRAGDRGRHQSSFAGEEVQLESFEGNLGQVFEVGGQLAGFGVGFERADQLGVDPEPRGDQEESVLVAGLGFADIDGAFERTAKGLGADREGADLGLIGTLAGPSEPKLAWASVQAVCPSAASGLIVKPSGRVTDADLISEGEAAKPRNWGALNSTLSPEGESVSAVVGLA